MLGPVLTTRERADAEKERKTFTFSELTLYLHYTGGENEYAGKRINVYYGTKCLLGPHLAG